MKKHTPTLTHVAHTKSPSLELQPGQLGYPGIRGEIHILALMAGDDGSNDKEKLHDTTERKFIVSALLSKSPYNSQDGRISGDFTKENGNSYLAIANDELKVQTPASDVAYHQFTVTKNAAGECSFLGFECVANDVSLARILFFTAVGPFTCKSQRFLNLILGKV